MNAPSRFTLDHLERLSDDRGLYEHAHGSSRREEHGYCTDDNARMLIVTTDDADDAAARRLNRIALRFVLDAQDLDGRSRNRMDRSGRWTDRATANDCWGRSLWALGRVARAHVEPTIRRIARNGFDKGVVQRSPWPRSMAFAALGAAEVLAVEADHSAARALLVDAVTTIGEVPVGAWSWPEARLDYANATLAEALIAAGIALDSTVDLERGLTMLHWLLELEMRDGHLSLCPVGGRGPSDVGPRFDQQPIEAAAMADACARAGAVTGDESWRVGLDAAARWFEGDNDVGLVMHDEMTGGAYDGLHPNGVNRNQGAESTLAYISTMQRARLFATN